MKPACSKRGFTLLEITIALAILATALVTLLAGINAGVLFSDRDRDFTIAAFLAQEKMSELEREPDKIASGYDDKGEFKGEFKRFEYHMVIEPDENAEALADYAAVPFEPLKAIVKISWHQGRVEQKFVLEEIFFPEVVVVGP